MHDTFLLAAGLGTRLRPLTNLRPKALLPVGGVPMLDHALAHCRAHGLGSAIVNAHHLWEQVAEWAMRNQVEVQVEWPEILGTGGGLRAALDRLDERVVVVNADVLSDVDLAALRAAVPDGGAAMALRPSPDAAQIGSVEADSSGRVVRVARVVEGEGGLPGTHFTGVHAMSREAIARVPPGGFACVVRTAYKALIPEGKIASIRHTGAWFDVGSPSAYLEANLAAIAGAIPTPVDPWTRGERGPEGSWLGPGAVVRGSISGSVIGDRAVVPADARLEGCVVWDGAVVPPGEHRRAVIYGDGLVLAVEGPAEIG